ncbi:MAG: thioredoxin domain-containing protein [Myxococcota bacterium]
MAQTPTPQLTFEVTTPDRPSYTVTLRKPQNIIGRESGDIVLNDPEASALHAEIDSTAGHVIVRDLGSSNGTWRDGDRLPQFALYEGQSFYCGNTELKLVSIDGDGAGLKPGQTAVGRTKVEGDAHDTLVGTGGDASSVQPPPGWSPPSPLGLGAPAPVAEQTGAAFTGPSHSTLPGPHAPSSAVTVPGAGGGSTPTIPTPSSTTLPGNVSSTLPGATPSTSTLPGRSVEPPEGPTDPPKHPTVQPASTPTLQGLGGAAPAPQASSAPEESVLSSAVSVPPGEAAAVSTGAATKPDGPVDAGDGSNSPSDVSASVFRPPVANAVIKGAGSAAKQPPTKAAATGPRRPSRWPRLLGIVGVTAVCVSAVAGIAYLAYTMLAGRNVAFTEDIAAELPQSAVGFVAMASLDDALALLGDDIPEPIHAQASDGLGFDPLGADGWRSLGIDPAAPVGLSLLAVDDAVVALSVGVHDEAALKTALSERLPTFIDPGSASFDWVERDFGDVPGLWLEEPPMAVLHRGDRSLWVFSPDRADAVAVSKQAQALAEVTSKSSLAGTEAFDEIVPPPGATLAMAYVDGSSLRNALPGGGFSVMTARLALADIDGIALAFGYEDDAIHMTYETIVRDGSRHLELLDGATRENAALKRVPGPVLGAYDLQVDPVTLDRTVGGALSAVGASLSMVEQEFAQDIGIDLRADVTQNLSGAMGAALLSMPSKDREAFDLKAVAWVGVADESKAADALRRVYEKNFSDGQAGDVSPRTVGEVTVYARPGNADREEPAVHAFVSGGFLWLLLGEIDPAEVIEGPASNGIDDARHPSIAAALKSGNHVSAFVDIRGLVTAIEPLLSKYERKDLAEVRDLVDMFETSTARLDRKGRTLVLRNTVHTADDVGLPGVVQAAMAKAGEAVAESLARAGRAKRCATLAEHVGTLSRKALEDAGAGLETAWEVERKVLEQCDSPDMTAERLDCYLAAESIQGLGACDAKHPTTPKTPDAPPPSDDVANDDQAEPKTVPYVEDIWPHLSDDPDSENPQPDVNYAVPLGPTPDVRGPSDALVTIVMFGDFECPHCRAVMPTLDEVLAQHGRDVRLVFRHMPLEKIHPAARAAARGALAASAQDKFWVMHDALFDKGNRLDADDIASVAESAGLDMTRYATDLASADVDRRLQRDIDTATKFGVRGTPAFFINGRYLGGRQTRSAFNAVINEEKDRALRFVERRGNTRKRLYEDMLTHFAPEVLQPTSAIEVTDRDAKRYTISTKGLPKKGATSFAQVEIIECGDFDCPFCARSRKALDETIDAFPSQVAVYFAHNPLSFHHGAEPAARAAAAADAQDKFWAMHDELFKDQSGKERTEADYARYAARIGLDIAQFKKDFAAAETAKLVEDQRTLCVDNGASATPTFFINGRRVTGAQDVDQFKALVEAELSTGI